MDVAGRRVLVLGLGDTGLSAARFLSRRGARVRVADSRATPPHADRLRAELPQVQVDCGPFRAESFERVEMIVVSPGIPVAEPLVMRARTAGIPVVGDIELFARALSRDGRPKVIAITGTNGKTTVTAMAGAICTEAGLATEVAGNISPAALDALMACEDAGRRPEAWVLELSSFQLETTDSLAPDAATVLNVTEDHLDRYPGIAEYAAAKARIFNGGGVQVLNRQDEFSCAMALPGRPIVTFGLDAPAGAGDYGLVGRADGPWLARSATPLMPVSELKVAGLHNAANALAATALASAIRVPDAAIVNALRKFRGLPHRVEWVAEVGGVAFFDDSKGTNVGATVAALGGMTQKVVLIAGGDAKGQDFSPLRPAVERGARAVVLIGRDADRIAAALAGGAVPVQRAADMEEAVRRSFEAASPGDAVLLSPACASLDMFRNYAHRAEVFIAAVKKLDQGGRAADVSCH
ncbi:MAG: UDP-N-acetylmuramoyl-L-alanine--D-glutamate ligase [Betaproteobacteria bacterium]|nr:UDP-N-acetylmuramoyl-L-alanine--D-glutamate ligase [Betaproteobacteria bacterium]